MASCVGPVKAAYSWWAVDVALQPLIHMQALLEDICGHPTYYVHVSIDILYLYANRSYHLYMEHYDMVHYCRNRSGDAVHYARLLHSPKP